MFFGFSAREASGQPTRNRNSRSLEMRELFIKDWNVSDVPSSVLRESKHKSNKKRLKPLSSVVFAFGVRLALLAAIRLPGLRNHICVNRIRILHGHLRVRKCE